MAIYKLGDEELRDANGGYIYREEDQTFSVINDQTGEFMEGGFSTQTDAANRAKELGQATIGISPTALQYLRKRNEQRNQ